MTKNTDKDLQAEVFGWPPTLEQQNRRLKDWVIILSFTTAAGWIALILVCVFTRC